MTASHLYPIEFGTTETLAIEKKDALDVPTGAMYMLWKERKCQRAEIQDARSALRLLDSARQAR